MVGARQRIKVGGFVFGFQQAIRLKLVESTIYNIGQHYEHVRNKY